MPRPKRSGSSSRQDVLRAEVLAFIDAMEEPPRQRDVLERFHLNRQDRLWLQDVLPEATEKSKKSAQTHHDRLPGVAILRVLERTRDGELIAEPAERNDTPQTPPPRIVIEKTARGKRGPEPAVGDLILARLAPVAHLADDHVTHRGRVIKLLTQKKGDLVGIFRAEAGGGGTVEPVDKKQLGRSWRIASGATNEAQDQDLVRIDIPDGRRHASPQARIVEVLGNAHSEKAVSTIAILAHRLPFRFSSEALAEAEKSRAPSLLGREDWRDIPFITIDPADAKDHDDAVHAEADPDPANPGGYLIRVAIADVATYVRPGSALDREARERGNSVYFPDRVVPMLPEALSNGLCSLKAGEDRAALAVTMVISARGVKRSHSFHRVLMRSVAGISYQRAQAAFDGHGSQEEQALVPEILKPLFQAYHCLTIERSARSPLDLDLPERKLLLDARGRVERVIVPERLAAHRLIEEMMILANVAAAETLEAQRTPLLYRVHESPSPEKLSALREFLKTLDIGLAPGRTIRPEQFNRILERVRHGPHETLVNEVVLRSQAQALYATENIGHFGLSLARYAHFTSPIRRYADLIVHRALIRALKLGDDGLSTQDIATLDETATQISGAERRAMAAERETSDRLIAYFLCGQIGAHFPARIGGVTKAGLFVTLKDTGADGFVPIATLGNEYFRVDEAGRRLVGERTGVSYRMGDSVEVRLVEAQPVAGALRFEIVSEGRPAHGRNAKGKPRILKRPVVKKKTRTRSTSPGSKKGR